VNPSGIEWTDFTWNPITGCTKVSPGCAHCYAERTMLRFRRGQPFLPGYDSVRLHPERLDQPYRQKQPARVFVCSMSDLFHEAVPNRFIAEVLYRAEACPHLTFQILTKRPERMQAWLADLQHDWPAVWPLPNLWAGTSVENRAWLHRVDLLRQTPAALRFLSVEPLLGDLGTVDLDGIGWVIVGGESGPRARPMRPEWARNLRDQCVAAGVPFFYKQQGAVVGHGAHELDGIEWRQFPPEGANHAGTVSG